MPSRPKPKRTLVSFDWAVKRLLKHKSSHPILEGFLSALFRRDIRIDTLLESESVAEAENDKVNRVDLLCQTSLGEQIIIEIQFYHQVEYFQRMLYATSRLVVSNMEQGMRYDQVKKVYSVNLVYFNLGEGTEYLYRGATHFRGRRALKLNKAQQTMFGKKHPYEVFPEYYIIKISNFGDNPKNALEEWIYYFKHTALPEGYSAKGLDEVEKQLKFDDMEPHLKSQYLKILRDLNADEDPLQSSWRDGEATGLHKGFLAGLEKGKKRGRAEGMRKGMEKGLEKGKMMGMEEGKLEGLEEGKLMGIEEGKLKGIEEGKLKGLQEGIEKGSKLQLETTVVKLFKRGMEISVIADIHQIEVEEVERILMKNEN